MTDFHPNTVQFKFKTAETGAFSVMTRTNKVKDFSKFVDTDHNVCTTSTKITRTDQANRGLVNRSDVFAVTTFKANEPMKTEVMSIWEFIERFGFSFKVGETRYPNGSIDVGNGRFPMIPVFTDGTIHNSSF